MEREKDLGVTTLTEYDIFFPFPQVSKLMRIYILVGLYGLVLPC